MWRAKERLLEVKDWCIIIINNTKGYNKIKLTRRVIRAPPPPPCCSYENIYVMYCIPSYAISDRSGWNKLFCKFLTLVRVHLWHCNDVTSSLIQANVNRRNENKS